VTTLSAEVEAALDLLGSCGCAIVPCTCGVKASIATLRTALERSARIEAAAKDVCDDDDGCDSICEAHDGEAECIGNGRCKMQTLRAALNREDG
jgi:hypothetical protein